MKDIDKAVMARLRAPFGCEKVGDRWRIHDANDDAIASCAPLEEGYARLIVQALNEHFERRTATVRTSTGVPLGDLRDYDGTE